MEYPPGKKVYFFYASTRGSDHITGIVWSAGSRKDTVWVLPDNETIRAEQPKSCSGCIEVKLSNLRPVEEPATS